MPVPPPNRPLTGGNERFHSLTGPNDRARAARHLAQVIGRSRALDLVLRCEQSPLCRELAYGCLRHYFSLAAAVDARLRRPLKARDLDIHCLLLVGAYQLHGMRIPDHAAIHETVAATLALGKPWAKGLVNAVLRKLAATGVVFGHEHPAWLQRRIRRQYPAEADALMAANNQRAPMSLRINRSRMDPEQYRNLLRQAEVGFVDSWLRETLLLRQPCPARSLPGFAEGWFAVQDASAQLVGDLARRQLKGGLRVLDACAAPGGKLFHLLESGLELKATALDVSSMRLQTLREIGTRLGHGCFNAAVADATKLGWWDGRPFDFVLLDAPCSGAGTLRRHPDIKVTRTPEQVAKATVLQRALLKNLWRTLKSGCTLLYSTCSILAEENDEIVEAFTAVVDNVRVRRVELPAGEATGHGWQMLPTEPSTDGLYIALIEKLS